MGIFESGVVDMKKLWMVLGALTFMTQAHCETPEKILEIENDSKWPLCARLIPKDDPTAMIEATIPSGETLTFNDFQFDLNGRGKNDYIMNIIALDPSSQERSPLLTKEFQSGKTVRITTPLVNYIMETERGWARP